MEFRALSRIQVEIHGSCCVTGTSNKEQHENTTAPGRWIKPAEQNNSDPVSCETLTVGFKFNERRPLKQ